LISTSGPPLGGLLSLAPGAEALPRRQSLPTPRRIGLPVFDFGFQQERKIFKVAKYGNSANRISSI